MALINSDLPRENSATKATMTLSERTWVSRRRSRSSMAASSSSWSFSHSDSSFRRSANSRRHAPCWSNCSLKEVPTTSPSALDDYTSSPAVTLRFLATRAVERCALSLPDAADHGAARPAGLPGPPIDHGFELEVTRLAVSVGEVAQRASTFLHGARQHFADRSVQLARAGQREARGTERGTDAS